MFYFLQNRLGRKSCLHEIDFKVLRTYDRFYLRESFHAKLQSKCYSIPEVQKIFFFSFFENFSFQNKFVVLKIFRNLVLLARLYFDDKAKFHDNCLDSIFRKQLKTKFLIITLVCRESCKKKFQFFEKALLPTRSCESSCLHHVTLCDQ